MLSLSSTCELSDLRVNGGRWWHVYGALCHDGSVIGQCWEYDEGSPPAWVQWAGEAGIAGVAMMVTALGAVVLLYRIDDGDRTTLQLYGGPHWPISCRLARLIGQTLSSAGFDARYDPYELMESAEAAVEGR